MRRTSPRLIVRLTAVVSLSALSTPALADSAMCTFPRNAWQSAVASGDSGRIAAARQRVVAARNNCPDLYAQVMAWKTPPRERPRTEDPPRRADPSPPPPPRELPNPINRHFRLVSRLAKDAPLPQAFDAGRGWLLGVNIGRLTKVALASGQPLPVPAPPPGSPDIVQIGAYNQTAGTFYAVGKQGQLAFCNAVAGTCAWPKKSDGVAISQLFASTNPGFDAWAIGKDAKGQAAVVTYRAGKPLVRIALPAFKLHRETADNRYLCTIPTRPQPPHELSCFDLLAKGKPTGRANIGGFIENPVADRTRWDEADSTRQGNFDAAGNRIAVFTDGELRVYTPTQLTKPQVHRLADLGIAPAARKFAIRFIDRGARIMLWDIRERFDTELFTFAVLDLDTQVAANRLRKFEVKFPVRKSGTADGPLAINAFHLGGDSFLFEAPFAQPVLFSTRDAKATPFPTPPGERADGYYGVTPVPEENLLLAKYSAIGDFHVVGLGPTLRQLGRPGSVNVWRLPGPGGYYFFHSLMDATNEWSEVRQYTPAP